MTVLTSLSFESNRNNNHNRIKLFEPHKSNKGRFKTIITKSIDIRKERFRAFQFNSSDNDTGTYTPKPKNCKFSEHDGTIIKVDRIINSAFR